MMNPIQALHWTLGECHENYEAPFGYLELKNRHGSIPGPSSMDPAGSLKLG